MDILYTKIKLMSRVFFDNLILSTSDFEFESHCGGGKFGSFSSHECEHYKIEFYQSARQVVKDCIWADDQILYNEE